MESLFLVYGLVLAALAAVLCWLMIKVTVKGNANCSKLTDIANEERFTDSENIVDLTVYKNVDISALRLIQDYSFIETSHLPETEKLKEILRWSQSLESFESTKREIIQSKAFLRPSELSSDKSNTISSI